MSLKSFKPYTKSTRGTILIDRANFGKVNLLNLLLLLIMLQKEEII